MPLREFPDALGRMWQAWDTYPRGSDHAGSAFAKYVANLPTQEGGQPTTVPEEYEPGWLTFKLGNALRRLTPIPAGWESADDAALRRYLDSAQKSPDVPPSRSSQ